MCTGSLKLYQVPPTVQKRACEANWELRIGRRSECGGSLSCFAEQIIGTDYTTLSAGEVVIEDGWMDGCMDICLLHRVPTCFRTCFGCVYWHYTSFSVPEPEWGKKKPLQSTVLVYKAKLINSVQTYDAGFQTQTQREKSPEVLAKDLILTFC